MGNTKSEEKHVAEQIASDISSRISVPEEKVKVRQNISKYNDKQRNSSFGETCHWVLVPAPAIPKQRSHRYYQENPQARRPSDKRIKEAKETLQSVEKEVEFAVQKHSDSQLNVEYVGTPSEREGYSVPSHEVTLNVRIQSVSQPPRS